MTFEEARQRAETVVFGRYSQQRLCDLCDLLKIETRKPSGRMRPTREMESELLKALTEKYMEVVV